MIEETLGPVGTHLHHSYKELPTAAETSLLDDNEGFLYIFLNQLILLFTSYLD